MKAVLRAVARPIGRGIRRIGDAGWRNGLDGSGRWLAVAFVVGSLRLLVRLSTRSRDVVYSRTLAPGETLKIDHLVIDRTRAQGTR